MKLQIIIFSFNRAMQLDTLLSTLIENWECPEYKIDVIYNYSTADFGKGYEVLSQKFQEKNVTLHKESTTKPDKVTLCEAIVPDNVVRLYRNPKLRHPKSDFRTILLNVIEKTTAENIMFLTDDSMFISKINIPTSDLDWINEAPEKRQFSLRLGQGVSSLPSSIKREGNYCYWNMYENKGNWGYPFSVDAHIYNKDVVLRLFKRYIFCNPNTLESNVVSSVRRAKTLEQGRCFADIKMLTFPINIVQNCVDNLSQNVSVEMLNQCYLQGETMRYGMDKEYNATKQYVTQIQFTDKEGNTSIININDELTRPNAQRDVTTSGGDEIQIIVAGDYSPKERIQKAIDCNEWHNLFPGLKEILSDTDYSIVNFESTIAEPSDKTITKIGSHLKTDYPSMYVLKKLGFDMITLANNHSMDYGETALLRTLDEAKKMRVETVGAGKNQEEAQKAKIINIKGKKLAVINACEHEFSIANRDKAGANSIDVIYISRQIAECKKNVDYVIVIIHGGVEHYQLPSMRMKKLYRYFVDCGADAVVNHHQHCFSGYEVYNGKPIFYGIGNFCFDSASDNKVRHETYNYGFMVKLRFEDDQVGFDLFPYEQCYQRAGVYLLEDRKKFDEKIDELNNEIESENRLAERFIQMAKRKRSGFVNVLIPYNNRIMLSLNARGLMPDMINKRKKMNLAAKINCESHLDILKCILSNNNDV